MEGDRLGVNDTLVLPFSHGRPDLSESGVDSGMMDNAFGRVVVREPPRGGPERRRGNKRWATVTLMGNEVGSQ